ncbi:MAG: tagaturonate reductase [Clostridia bacterium]|nr:tagaturonate reductase [Clostridia bacterium]
MIKVLQIGEGNFLRSFVDLYFDTLNREGLGEYGVSIVKPIRQGSLDAFARQDNRYHVVLRGSESGLGVERVYSVDCLDKVIDPFENYSEYISIAKDPELKIIVSNTTEAGICYNGNDKIDGFDGVTYPAKLTKFLYERFSFGLSGVYILPVELIDNNADELKSCVDRYITLWSLPAEFKRWNDEENFYCNTLVDRIVSGYPRDEETREHLTELIGREDGLMSVAEPFGLWAVEKKGNIEKYVKQGLHNIEVVLTDNIAYYKKRKVRVLNGSHTNLVPAGLMLGAVTVYDCMTDARLSRFVMDTLDSEINPYVSTDIEKTREFADSVRDRFMNPYLNHQLTSIALNSISKWRARVLPSFKDYYADKGRIPERLTIGLSYLMALYSLVKREGEVYTVSLPERDIEIKDDKAYLDYFADGGSVGAFLSDASVFGEDLTKYAGLADTVSENIEKIRKGISLI